MQAESFDTNLHSENMMYSGLMSKQKSSLKQAKRHAMGEHLASLRKQAGLSQYELAKLLDEPQSNISFWELTDKPPRSDILPKLAKILGVRVETILNISEKAARRGGPTGKVQKIFEDVSQLPRKQQDKIVEFVSAFVNQYQSQ